MSDGDTIEVARFASRSEADEAVARLRADGIEPMVQVDDGGGSLPMLDFTRFVRVRVVPEDEERARAILEAPAG